MQEACFPKVSGINRVTGATPVACVKMSQCILIQRKLETLVSFVSRLETGDARFQHHSELTTGSLTQSNYTGFVQNVCFILCLIVFHSFRRRIDINSKTKSCLQHKEFVCYSMNAFYCSYF